jgi:hypothetical protein
MENGLAARPSSIKHDLKVLLWVIPEPSDCGDNGDDLKQT